MTARETFDAFFRTVLVDKDVDAWMALWADEPTVTMWGSDLDERAHGREAIRALGVVIASHDLSFDWEQVDAYERGDVGWVNARGTFAYEGERRPYRATMVVVGGRVHTFDGSVPD